MLPIPTSIHQLQADLMEGRYSAQELLLTYLRRIAALDSGDRKSTRLNSSHI